MGSYTTRYVRYLIYQNCGLIQNRYLDDLATKFFAGNKPPVAASVKDASGALVTPVVVDPHTLPPVEVVPFWPLGLNLDMYVYLTTSPNDNPSAHRNEGLPHFVWNNISYGDYNDHRVVQFDVQFPEVRHLFLGTANLS